MPTDPSAAAAGRDGGVSRLQELARQAACDNHVANIETTGSHPDALHYGHVNDCDHPDCQLVRAALRDGGVSRLTKDDCETIAEGIDHFIIGIDADPEVERIWQPYIDKLKAAAVRAGGVPDSQKEQT